MRASWQRPLPQMALPAGAAAASQTSPRCEGCDTRWGRALWLMNQQPHAARRLAGSSQPVTGAVEESCSQPHTECNAVRELLLHQSQSPARASAPGRPLFTEHCPRALLHAELMQLGCFSTDRAPSKLRSNTHPNATCSGVNQAAFSPPQCASSLYPWWRRRCSRPGGMRLFVAGTWRSARGAGRSGRRLIS